MTTVTFVIPHMGRENLLITTLHSILALDKGQICVDVVIVSKNDNFSKELLDFKKSMAVTFLKVDRSITISDQRNIGVSKTQSDFIAFIDADIELSNNWLIEMTKLIGKDGIVLSSAIQVPGENPTQLEYVRVVLSNLAIDCEMEFLPGRNLLLSREVFEKSGGFPSELVTCEDYVFTQRVSKQGKLFYSSKAQYVHLGEDKRYWPMAKKEVWRGQSNLASIKGRQVPLSEYPSFVAPPLFTFFLISMLIGALGQQWLLSIICGLGCAGILGVYVARLLKKRRKYPDLFAIVWFYILYFPARTIGTLVGVIKNLQPSDYK